MTPDDATAKDASGSLMRALRVLERLAGMEQPASLLDIAAATGLTKTKAYRVLRSLQDDGYVDHAGRDGYRIGSRSIALATLIGPRPALLQRARPILAQLAGRVSETATLHLRSGGYRVLVLGAEPPRSVLFRRIMVGERAPLTSGCSGTSILAYLPDREVDDIIRTHARGSQRKALTSLVEQIRNDGYATSYGSNHVGLNGISAPLLDPDTGLALGSIAIAGPSERLDKATLTKLAPPLIASCTALAPRLAAVLGPHSSVRVESLDVNIQDFLDA
jgi:DNA-binding IclR family transcriptional regulator